MGDVMLGRGIARRHTSSTWSGMFAVVQKEIEAADLALANLESPVTRIPLVQPGYDLRASPDSLQALTAADLDLVTLANNHILDSGVTGLKETQAALTRAGILYAGSDPEPVIVPVHEKRLALLSVDDVLAPIDGEGLMESIRQARKSADFVVVSIHWGIEYSPAPSLREKEIARKMIESGADIVFGHHPHVLQPVEWVENQGGRAGLIAYSLGNAVFDQPTPPSARQGAVLLIELDSHGVSGVSAVPFEIDVRQGVLQKAGPEAEEAIFRRLSLPPFPNED